MAQPGASTVVNAQDAPPSAEEVTWGIQPASASDGNATRPSFNYQLDPGAHVTDAVRITNFSEQPLTLRVSSHDAYNTDSGDFSVLTSDQPSVDLGTWVELAADEVTIPARGHVDVPFRLTVPSNAPPGDHAGGIVAAMTVERERSDGTPVAIEHRVGSRIYTRVSGDIHPSLVVTRMAVDFQGEGVAGVAGSMAFEYTVRNAGNIRLSAGQSVAASGWFGLGGATAELDPLPELLPGGEFTNAVTLDDVRPAIRMTGELTLTPSEPGLDEVSGRATTWALPWRAIVLLAIVASYLVWRRRRGRGPGPAEESDDTTEPDPDESATLESEPEPDLEPDLEPMSESEPEPELEPMSGSEPESESGSVRSIALVAVLALMPLISSGTQQGSVAQSVTLDRSTVAIGDEVSVALAGWDPGPAQVELCGNAARRGSVDCDTLGSSAAGVGADGAGRTTLVIGEPPVACPCVVRVTQLANGATAAVPITVDGLPEAAGIVESPGPEQRRIEVAATRIERDERNAAVFGLGAGRRVTVTVRNPGTSDIEGVVASARLNGRGASEQVIEAPAPFDLGPGAEHDVVLAFDLPAPALGDYRVVGEVIGGDASASFSAGTDHTPWGLINGAAIAVAIVVVVGARSRRRHTAGGSPA